MGSGKGNIPDDLHICLPTSCDSPAPNSRFSKTQKGTCIKACCPLYRTGKSYHHRIGDKTDLVRTYVGSTEAGGCASCNYYVFPTWPLDLGGTTFCVPPFRYIAEGDGLDVYVCNTVRHGDTGPGHSKRVIVVKIKSWVRPWSLPLGGARGIKIEQPVWLLVL